MIAAWFAAGALLAPAQRLSTGPEDGGPTTAQLPKEFLEIPAVAGAPFSATAVVSLEQYGGDDGNILQRTFSLIARDSKGRTRSEVRRLMPESFHGSPQVLVVRIYDPETHTRLTYDPARHLVLRELKVTPGKPFFSPDATKTDDLGTSMMNGVQTRGTRRTYTLPKHGFGWGKPPQREEEDWTSEELHLSLLVKYVDERAGELTVGISNLKREEPPASMFTVPAGKMLEAPPEPATP